MTTYGFAQSLAVDESMTPARNAVGYVYDYTVDTAYAVPLDVTDLGGIPIAGNALVANDQGVVPPFQVVDHPLVRWKSGPYITEMLSGKGVVDRLDSVEATAIAAAASAAASAAAAATAALPPGATPDYILKADGSGVPQWVPDTAGSGIAGAPTDWPSTFPPALHNQPASTISDSTAVGRAVVTAANAAAARTAIGAGTGNGTSNLAIGTGPTDAASATHGHNASLLTFAPTGSLTALNVQDAIVQAAATGGGGSGATTVLVYTYRSGAYPTLPTTKPTGAERVIFQGPVQPTTVASWMGTGSTQCPTFYDYLATT